MYYNKRRKKSFNRVDENLFGLMARRRRAFDRLEDGPFLLGKRQYSAEDIRLQNYGKIKISFDKKK